jgi:hypothetical protein
MAKKGKVENTVEIMILIARIIMLILSGMSSVGAVEEVAKASNVASTTLWGNLPNRFK